MMLSSFQTRHCFMSEQTGNKSPFSLTKSFLVVWAEESHRKNDSSNYLPYPAEKILSCIYVWLKFFSGKMTNVLVFHQLAIQLAF